MRRDSRHQRGFEHDAPNQIVGQQVRVEFFPYHVRSLAPQMFHLHVRLEAPEVQFGLPAATIEIRQFVRRVEVDVDQRRRQGDRARAKAGLVDPISQSAQFHDRMPVILSPNDYAEWLDPQAREPGKLMTPFPAADMAAVAVNPIVNNARNEGPECIEPISSDEAPFARL